MMSKNHAQHQLRRTRRLCATDGPEIRVPKRMPWDIEVHEVEHVEEFATKFRFKTLRNREGLCQAEIDVVTPPAT